MSILSINKSSNVRLSLPSKGRLSEDSITFLNNCDMKVDKTNPRQYQATIRGLSDMTVLFQRPSDIVISVRNGSVEFGISGLDVIEEYRGEQNQILVLHDELNFGQCSLNLAVPEEMESVTDMNSLREYSSTLAKPLKVATKFSNLTGKFLDKHNIPHQLISAEGTLETAPAIGYADIISDLVSSGQTLRDNRLRPLNDGLILKSQAALIANMNALKNNPQALNVARYLLEFIEARQRGEENVAIFANMRGSSSEDIAESIFNQPTIGGLQGPTISRVIVRDNDPNWYAVNIIVKRAELFTAINELRMIGGSGVVVQPVNYIFEEEPPRYIAMLNALSD